MESKKARLHKILFETDNPEGVLFNKTLMFCIITSVLVVFLDSIYIINARYKPILDTAEWIFTILFTIEYALRIYASKKRLDYIFSFYGIIDLLAIIPSYLSVIFIGSESLLVLRTFRLLRVFRIFKILKHLDAARILVHALKESRPKITVFLAVVLIIAIATGSLMYLIEGGENKFTSIPKATYWAIVTLTTVGYGDIVPQTVLGQMIATLLMILGYGVIAVPTGIVSSELTRQQNLSPPTPRTCPSCQKNSIETTAKYCNQCGTRLPE